MSNITHVVVNERGHDERDATGANSGANLLAIASVMSGFETTMRHRSASNGFALSVTRCLGGSQDAERPLSLFDQEPDIVRCRELAGALTDRIGNLGDRPSTIDELEHVVQQGVSWKV